MKKLLILFTCLLFLVGCLGEVNPLTPNNYIPMIDPQETEVSILNQSYNGSGVNVEYSIKNIGEYTIDTCIILINIMATNKNYIYEGHITNLNILVNETETNTIFVDTLSNNFTNLKLSIMSGFTW